MKAHPGLPVAFLAAVLLAGALALLPACDGDSTVQDTRDIEKAYYALRDAVLQGDDEAFFAMHGTEAKRWALDAFPAIRASYLSGIPEEREAFRAIYHVTEAEFLESEPRAMVVKMMPLKSGWRERRDLFRSARVKDVAIDYIPLPGGGTERRGRVELELPEGAGAIAGTAIPTVIFIKEKEGWRRQAFFIEAIPKAPSPR